MLFTIFILVFVSLPVALRVQPVQAVSLRFTTVPKRKSCQKQHIFTAKTLKVLLPTFIDFVVNLTTYPIQSQVGRLY